MADTSFDLFRANDFSVLSQVKDRLILVGQNLYSLSLPKNNFKERLLLALQAKELHVELLMCDTTDFVINAISEVAVTIPGLFKSHLESAIAEFEDWSTEFAGQELLGKFSIRSSRRVGNVSLTIIDPDRTEGRMLITPILGSAAKDRPCFWLTKTDHTQVFDYYYAWYQFVADEHEHRA